MTAPITRRWTADKPTVNGPFWVRELRWECACGHGRKQHSEVDLEHCFVCGRKCDLEQVLTRPILVEVSIDSEGYYAFGIEWSTPLERGVLWSALVEPPPADGEAPA